MNRPPSIKGVERQTQPTMAQRGASVEAAAVRRAICGQVCPGTRISRSSENVPSARLVNKGGVIS
jgi:hypothetical protein